MNYKVELWKSELEELNRKRKFMPDDERDERELRALKLKVLEGIQRGFRIDSIAHKAFWICILVALIAFGLAFVTIDANGDVGSVFLVVVIAAIFASVGVKKLWQKSIDENLDEMIQFDKQNLDGEILFKMKNGLKL